MAARIEWGPLQRALNARQEKVVTQNFAIRSHDGWVNGQIVVQDTPDAAARAEIEGRLALLLKDAIAALGG